jgi:hypothetical protein
MTENIVGKRKMILGRRKISTKDLKNESASKAIIDFDVMVNKRRF